MALRAVLLVFFLVLLPMSAFTQETETKHEAAQKAGDDETAAGIRAAVKSYIAAFQAKDIDGVMAVFSKAPNTVMMGTGPDEVWLGEENIRMAHLAFFSNFDKETSQKVLVSSGANGDLAWLVSYFTVNQQDDDKPDTFQINMSTVLERIDGTWYIAAMHFSNLIGQE